MLIFTEEATTQKPSIMNYVTAIQMHKEQINAIVNGGRGTDDLTIEQHKEIIEQLKKAISALEG
jgi:hypothetical protein